MKKILLVFAMVFCTLFLTSCGVNSSKFYHGIPDAKLPKSCMAYRDDVCGLFDCMVDMCWCDDSRPGFPVIYDPTGEIISDEDDAIAIVNQYLASRDSEDPLVWEYSESYQILPKRAVKLNSVFYNVFAEGEKGEEIVFTVAADGKVIMTLCGV